MKLANQFKHSEVWVQKAAKDQNGLHSDELDKAILEMAKEYKNVKESILREIRKIHNFNEKKP